MPNTDHCYSRHSELKQSPDWLLLPLAGYQAIGNGQSLELRTCTVCGSTIAKLAPDPRPTELARCLALFDSLAALDVATRCTLHSHEVPAAAEAARLWAGANEGAYRIEEYATQHGHAVVLVRNKTHGAIAHVYVHPANECGVHS